MVTPVQPPSAYQFGRMHLLSCQLYKSLDGRNNLTSQYKDHLAEASRRYASKNEDKLKASLDKTSMLCIPSEVLFHTHFNQSTQLLFSKKNQTYNCSIYDSTAKKRTCLVWNESKASQVTNEMASCLIMLLNTRLQSNVSERSVPHEGKKYFRQDI